MENGTTTYEGWIYGIGEWQYSKISKLLKSAFPDVSYEYLDDNTGTVWISGPSPMFEEDEDNLLATFDLVADQIIESGKGVLLSKKWDNHGSVELKSYEFGSKTWTQKDFQLGA
ncbi:hypothetical protein [Desulfovibrio ferrophilus]|uniref:Putative Polysaccharide deacetylase family protein n=1 Tax=Desulfovibrio ferrophilus TaxID=241368 RepID=A0A2Z6B3D7_9BACT|nr:hypothetical protein [Desulfovibrio ferrophilus]BBD10029.1 putative Polysaccharide deacetylase family protein [Desulfovibrio ferrophilus]